jgi:hypothetical protein
VKLTEPWMKWIGLAWSVAYLPLSLPIRVATSSRSSRYTSTPSRDGMLTKMNFTRSRCSGDCEARNASIAVRRRTMPFV